jgi:hypothetical protein
MERRIYFVQPSYRDKHGTLLKGRRQSLHSAALPALSAAVPGHWHKTSCIEFFQDVDLETDASVVAITSMGYDFPRGRELAREFTRRGKIVLFEGWQAGLSRGKLDGICDALVLGNPGPSALGRILDDAEAGRLAAEYRCGVEIDYPWDYSVLDGKRIDYLPVVTGVGCPNRCAFCCIAAVYQGRYTPRAIECVMADVRAVAARSRFAAFVDSNVYGNRDHLVALCGAMRAEGRLGGGAVDGGRRHDPRRVPSPAGCRVPFVGLETPDQATCAASAAHLAALPRPVGRTGRRDRGRRLLCSASCRQRSRRSTGSTSSSA